MVQLPSADMTFDIANTSGQGEQLCNLRLKSVDLVEQLLIATQRWLRFELHIGR
jgi:hypothetical protein